MPSYQVHGNADYQDQST